MSQTMSQSTKSNLSHGTTLSKMTEAEINRIEEKRREEKEENKKTCDKLKHLFHMAMLMGTLPYLKTKEKMMNYLNTKGNPDWTAGYIWCLADSNKIDWVNGYGDPTPYEEYKKAMNQALAKYLHPK